MNEYAMLMRTCIEVEANFKAILAENTFTPSKGGRLSMSHYRRINVIHHLSSYEISRPIWDGQPAIFRPFEGWKSHENGSALPWYTAYNSSKHDRHSQFKEANLENLVGAVAGLVTIMSSQFRDHDFGAGPELVSCAGGYHDFEPTVGSLIRIKYPDDWTDDELYDFDWAKLKEQSERFNKIDYDKIGP